LVCWWIDNLLQYKSLRRSNIRGVMSLTCMEDLAHPLRLTTTITHRQKATHE
jgi:hypothetical protein